MGNDLDEFLGAMGRDVIGTCPRCSESVYAEGWQNEERSPSGDPIHDDCINTVANKCAWCGKRILVSQWSRFGMMSVEGGAGSVHDKCLTLIHKSWGVSNE